MMIGRAEEGDSSLPSGADTDTVTVVNFKLTTD